MADAARKEKLAAAKKRLKQFQKTGKPASNSPTPSEKKEETSQKPKEKQNKKTVSSDEIIPIKDSDTVRNEDNRSVNDKPDVIKNDVGYPSATSTPISHGQHSNRPSESTERLQQLSRQINGLINEGSENGTNGINELESRNTELAAQLQQQTVSNQQLQAQLQDVRKQNSRLQQSLETEKKGFEDRLKRELGALKEQLQVHIQTIGILVAEKTELQSSVTQNQKTAQQKLEEIEELSGRLKASRQRVADLERSFTSASSSSQKHEQTNKENVKEIDRLKLELYKINKSNEEHQQKNSELQEKLQKKVSEHNKLEDELIEVRGKLEMTELYVTQLQNGSEKADETSTVQIEQLLSEKAELNTRIDQYEESFQRVSRERDEISRQYQDYIEQLQQQTQLLQTQINQLVSEKEQVTHECQTLQQLTDQLQSKQDLTEQKAEEASQKQSSVEGELQSLQGKLDSLQKTHDAQVADNSQLSRLVIEKEERLMELELCVQRLNDSQVDRERLLDTMQSDKTALSRAMAQNKELKSQLAELQNGFVKMSNDNMELLSQLQGEQHVSSELGTRLSQQEEELREIRHQLVQKEMELEQVSVPQHLDLTEEEKEMRLQQFQEQSPILETLQRELASAQDTINALTNQNSDLRSHMIRASSTEDLTRDDTGKVESLSAAIRQLELERNEVIDQLKQEQKERLSAQDSLHNMQEELAKQTPATLNGDVINKAQFEALQHAMQQLEVKFSKAMRDKADLSDKTEQLEHIIMQLQGETDTIGEYVALYQQQRSILRQRTLEKDDYISRLAREREELTDKLGQLQALVMQLLGEKQMLHAYPNNNNNPTSTAAAAAALSNHIPSSPEQTKKPLTGKLGSSNLEDWPDYTSSSDESDTSEVEHIIAGQHQSSPSSTVSLSPKHTPVMQSPEQEDHTAKQIMNLLTEIGTSNLVERTIYEDRHFLHCTHCTGRVLHL